jgi:hypothetical protein
VTVAHDFEDMDDLSDLSDDELRRLVRSRLTEHRGLDIDDITVSVRDGAVRLSGRVGTEAERRVAEHVLTDVIGVASVQNDLVVDALRRSESPEAVDDHIAEEDETAGLLLGDRAVPLSPEADHLAEDLDSRLYGTTDVGNAIERGTAWTPPSAPTPEGLSGDDASPADLGEDH